MFKQNLNVGVEIIIMKIIIVEIIIMKIIIVEIIITKIIIVEIIIIPMVHLKHQTKIKEIFIHALTASRKYYKTLISTRKILENTFARFLNKL